MHRQKKQGRGVETDSRAEFLHLCLPTCSIVALPKLNLKRFKIVNFKATAFACVLLVTGFRPAEARTVAQTETFQTIVTLTDTTVASQPVPVQRPLGVSALMAELEMEEVDLGDSIVARAMKHLGARYRYGHTGPKTFDCSGFTSYVFGLEDIKLSRTSRSQFQEGSVVKRIADLQAGDLVFFGGRRSSRSVGHVGIVTEVNPENNTFKFVHASNSGVKVDESTSSYYKRRYIGARRVLKTNNE